MLFVEKINKGYKMKKLSCKSCIFLINKTCWFRNIEYKHGCMYHINKNKELR